MLPPQIREILRFKARVSKRAGRDISLSEAIANWLALGYGDEFIEQINAVGERKDRLS